MKKLSNNQFVVLAMVAIATTSYFLFINPMMKSFYLSKEMNNISSSHYNLTISKNKLISEYEKREPIFISEGFYQGSIDIDNINIKYSYYFANNNRLFKNISMTTDTNFLTRNMRRERNGNADYKVIGSTIKYESYIGSRSLFSMADIIENSSDKELVIIQVINGKTIPIHLEKMDINNATDDIFTR